MLQSPVLGSNRLQIIFKRHQKFPHLPDIMPSKDVSGDPDLARTHGAVAGKSRGKINNPLGESASISIFRGKISRMTSSTTTYCLWSPQNKILEHFEQNVKTHTYPCSFCCCCWRPRLRSPSSSCSACSPPRLRRRSGDARCTFLGESWRRIRHSERESTWRNFNIWLSGWRSAFL